MPNYYFNSENNKRGFYEVKGENINVFEVLNHNTIVEVLNKLIATPIYNVKIEDNNTVVIFKDFTRLIISNNAFKKHDDVYNAYLEELRKAIKETYEKEMLKKHFKEGTKPKINRAKSNQYKAMFIAGSLSLGIILTSIIPSLNHDLKKDSKKDDTPKISNSITMNDTATKKASDIDDAMSFIPEMTENLIPKPEDIIPKETSTEPTEESPAPEEIAPIEETPVIDINLDYEPYIPPTEQYDKYASTYEVCGQYCEYYAKRWGLPPELISAQLTQESPNVENGTIDNPGQLTYSLYENKHFKVPVYDESGFTGTYDEFDFDLNYAKTVEGNVKYCIATVREYVDMYKSVITGIFAYNQGPYALSLACKYYGLNIEDYRGEENAIKARDLVVKYYRDLGKKHGDPNYLENVFKFLPIDERGDTLLEAYIGDKKVNLAINNNLSYNKEPQR